jgi:hypothetical protein
MQEQQDGGLRSLIFSFNNYHLSLYHLARSSRHEKCGKDTALCPVLRAKEAKEVTNDIIKQKKESR